jgi:hypothetical protein
MNHSLAIVHGENVRFRIACDGLVCGNRSQSCRRGFGHPRRRAGADLHASPALHMHRGVLSAKRPLLFGIAVTLRRRSFPGRPFRAGGGHRVDLTSARLTGVPAKPLSVRRRA